MQGFTIFVEGADTIQQLRKVPVYFVPEEKYAARICEGMGETEYAQFDFTFEQCTKSDLGKIPAWAVMIEDVRNGVYGDIVANISDMAERMHRFMTAPDSQPPATTPSDAATGGDALAADLLSDPNQATAAAGNGLPINHVTLGQMAAYVNRSTRTLERWAKKKSFPKPKVIGGGGKPHEYDWTELRPVLEKLSGRPLPERVSDIRVGHARADRH